MNISGIYYLVYLRLGIIDVKFHVFRHTFITDLAANGYGLNEIQYLAGHEHIKTTQGYIHLNHEDMIKAVEIINNKARAGNNR